jgi:hypothetical protein
MISCHYVAGQAGAAPRSESVREAEEVGLVDSIQHFHGSARDDLVLQHGNADRSLPTICLGDVHPPAWPGTSPAPDAVRPHEPGRMTRSRCGSLRLHRMKRPFTAPHTDFAGARCRLRISRSHFCFQRDSGHNPAEPSARPFSGHQPSRCPPAGCPPLGARPNGASKKSALHSVRGSTAGRLTRAPGGWNIHWGYSRSAAVAQLDRAADF